MIHPNDIYVQIGKKKKKIQLRVFKLGYIFLWNSTQQWVQLIFELY